MQTHIKGVCMVSMVPDDQFDVPNLKYLSAERRYQQRIERMIRLTMFYLGMLSEQVPCRDPDHTLPVPVVAFSEPRKARQHRSRHLRWCSVLVAGLPPLGQYMSIFLVDRPPRFPFDIKFVGASCREDYALYLLFLSVRSTCYWCHLYIPFSLPDKRPEP